MLLPPKEAIVMKYNLPSDKHYATALAYVPDSKVLISGGNKGRICKNQISTSYELKLLSSLL
jgi:hypothetical protein